MRACCMPERVDMKVLGLRVRTVRMMSSMRSGFGMMEWRILGRSRICKDGFRDEHLVLSDIGWRLGDFAYPEMCTIL
jgi:hypothetical protein